MNQKQYLEFDSNSSDKYREGREYYKKGKYKNAILSYNEALKSQPKNLYIIFNKARALSKNGQYWESITSYEQIVDSYNQLEEEIDINFEDVNPEDTDPKILDLTRLALCNKASIINEISSKNLAFESLREIAKDLFEQALSIDKQLEERLPNRKKLIVPAPKNEEKQTKLEIKFLKYFSSIKNIDNIWEEFYADIQNLKFYFTTHVAAVNFTVPDENTNKSTFTESSNESKSPTYKIYNSTYRNKYLTITSTLDTYYIMQKLIYNLSLEHGNIFGRNDGNSYISDIYLELKKLLPDAQQSYIDESINDKLSSLNHRSFNRLNSIVMNFKNLYVFDAAAGVLAYKATENPDVMESNVKLNLDELLGDLLAIKAQEKSTRTWQQKIVVKTQTEPTITGY